jgi:hypothetical protein
VTTTKSQRTTELLASAVRILKTSENSFNLEHWRTTMARTPTPKAPRPIKQLGAPKHARHAKPSNTEPSVTEAPLDTKPEGTVQSGFSIFNQTPVKESLMSAQDAEKMTTTAEERKAQAAVAKAERDAVKAANATAKAELAAEKLAAKEAKATAKAEATAAKAQARADAKAAREARLAELGPQSKMSALRDAKKNYVKSATGLLRSNDELAQALDTVTATNVIPMALVLLKLEENPYARLNVGQQSMNLRNRLRGALKKGLVTIAQVIEVRDTGGYAIPAEEIAAKEAARAEREAQRETNRALKATKEAAKAEATEAATA